jgi:hypothetical protein
VIDYEAIEGLAQSDLAEHGCTLVKMIQLQEDRPFVVAKAKDRSGRSLIFKMQRLRPTPEKNLSSRSGMMSEICFVRDLAPRIIKRLGERGEHRIVFPEFVAANEREECPYLIESEFEEGRIAGGIHWVHDDVLELIDLTSIINLIEEINSLDVEGVRRLGPMIPDRTVDPEYWYTWAKTEVTKYEEPLREVLAAREFAALHATLEAKREFLSQLGPPRLTACDINPSNILKLPDGRLGMIDWERLRFTTSPVHDYGFMYADLWCNRQLQDDYMGLIMERHTTAHFHEAMRLDLIFNRYVGEINHWQDLVRKPSEPNRSWNRKALETIRGMMFVALYSV